MLDAAPTGKTSEEPRVPLLLGPEDNPAPRNKGVLCRRGSVARGRDIGGTTSMIFPHHGQARVREAGRLSRGVGTEAHGIDHHVSRAASDPQLCTDSG